MIWPAAVLTSYPGFIVYQFVIGFGLSILETAENPFFTLWILLNMVGFVYFSHKGFSQQPMFYSKSFLEKSSMQNSILRA